MSKIRSICIVDDSSGMRTLGVRILEDLGLNVVTATDGYQALSVIRDANPDACLIDLEMPNINGLRLIELLREWKVWGVKPIAMLSGATTIFDEQAGMLSGADLYITKPFTKATIQDALAKMGELCE